MKSDFQSFIDRHAGGERAVIVQVDFYPQHDLGYLEEFKELVMSAGIQILAVVQGKRDKPDSKYYVGKGKAEEIAETVKLNKAEVVLFNHELSPGQGRNLERLCDCRVITRSELILDIFAQRARSYEGKLQVELAQLQHLSTHLVGGWTHLERQKGGIGLRGPGETQLETDRRLLGNRIKHIKKRLAKVVTQREQGRKARKKAAIPTVSLVGYTNAGKSTLFNKLAGSDVYAADQLFATLDPTLRQVKINQLGAVILADTVGFIRDLPHDLVAAFRATLEEVAQADLLLHVIDCSNPQFRQMRENVDSVLDEIDANDVPQLLVYNKIDLLEDVQPRIDYNDQGIPRRVWVSALTESGFDLLFQAIRECVTDRMLECEITLRPDQSKLRAKLFELDAIIEESFIDDQYKLKIRLSKAHFNQYIKPHL